MSYLRLISLLFVFTNSFVFGQSEFLLEQFESLQPFSQSMNTVRFKEVCNFPKGRTNATKSEFCKDEATIVPDISQLKNLVEFTESQMQSEIDSDSFNQSKLGNHYHNAKKFIKMFEDFDQCNSQTDEEVSHANNRLLQNVGVEFNRITCDQNSNSSLSVFTNIAGDEAIKNAEKLGRGLDLARLESEIARESLKNSVNSFMKFNQNYGGKKLGEDEINEYVDSVCSKTKNVFVNTDRRGKQNKSKKMNICNDEIKSEILSYAKSSNDEAKAFDPKFFITQINENIDELNKKLNEYNTQKDEISKKWSETKVKDRASQRVYDSKLKSLEKEKWRIHQEFIVSYTELLSKEGNEILITKSLQDKIGKANFEKSSEVFPELSKINEADIVFGRTELLSKSINQTRDLLDMNNDLEMDMFKVSIGHGTESFEDRRTEVLKDLIGNNPKAASKILSQNPSYLSQFCRLNTLIAQDRKYKRWKDRAYIVAGVGVGAAAILTGIGVGPGAAMLAALGASVALTVSEGTYHLNQAEKSRLKEAKMIASILTQNNDHQSFNDLNETVRQYEESQFNAKLVFGLGSLDILGINQAARIGKLAYGSKNLSSLSSRIEGMNKIINKISRSPEATKNFRKIAQEFPQKDLEKLFEHISKLSSKEQDQFFTIMAKIDFHKSFDISKLLKELEKISSKSEEFIAAENFILNKMYLNKKTNPPYVAPVHTKTDIIANSEIVEDTERIDTFEGLIQAQFDLPDFKLTQQQREAVIKAHNQDGFLFEMTRAQIDSRVTILREAGLGDKAIKLGLDLGIFGKQKASEALIEKKNRLLNFLSKDTVGRPTLDIDAKKDLAMEDIRSIILNSPPQEFNTLWKFISKKDLKKMKDALDSGEIQMKPKEKERFLALFNWVENDEYDVLWKNSNGNAIGALQTRYTTFRGSSSEGNVGGTIAGNDTYALTAYEGEMVRKAAGIDKASRVPMGSTLRQFINPPVDEVKRVVEFHNLVRDQLKHVDEVNTSLDNYINSAQKFQFSEEEMSSLLKLREKNRAIRADARADLEQAYGGQNIFHGGIIVNEKTSPYEIDKIIQEKGLLSRENSTDYVRGAEGIIEELNLVLNANRSRLGQPIRDVEDFTSGGLKIRNKQYERTSNGARYSEDLSYSKDANVSFDIKINYEESYEVPVTKQRSDGKGGTESYTDYETRWRWTSMNKEITPEYSDIIDDALDSYSPGSSVSAPLNGRNASISSVSPEYHLILKRSQNARKLEGNFRQTINSMHRNMMNRLEKHVDILANKDTNPSEYLDWKNDLDIDIKTLEEYAQEAQQYASKSDTQIKSNWADDLPKDFKDRMSKISNSYAETLKLMKVYREQFARMEYELTITPDLPDYTIEYNKMRWVLAKNYAAKAGIVFTGGAIGTVKACEYLLKENIVTNRRNCEALVNSYRETKDGLIEKVRD